MVIHTDTWAFESAHPGRCPTIKQPLEATFDGKPMDLFLPETGAAPFGCGQAMAHIRLETLERGHLHIADGTLTIDQEIDPATDQF